MANTLKADIFLYNCSIYRAPAYGRRLLIRSCGGRDSSHEKTVCIKGKNFRDVWENRIRKYIDYWPKLFLENTDLECDSGRYPNFFWGWGKYIVLKVYEEGDLASPRPEQYQWNRLHRFQAISPLTGRPEPVSYWLGVQKDKEFPLLWFFVRRFLRECHSWKQDFPDFSISSP